MRAAKNALPATAWPSIEHLTDPIASLPYRLAIAGGDEGQFVGQHERWSNRPSRVVAVLTQPEW
jgi:hypothetical protein